MDDLTIYVFVRGDLPEEQQLVQAAHAVFDMARVTAWPDGEPRIIALDGGSSEKAFNKTLRKLDAAAIGHARYTDPDSHQLGITAIATVPVTREQAHHLSNYRLRRFSVPTVV